MNLWMRIEYWLSYDSNSMMSHRYGGIVPRPLSSGWWLICCAVQCSAVWCMRRRMSCDGCYVLWLDWIHCSDICSLLWSHRDSSGADRIRGRYPCQGQGEPPTPMICHDDEWRVLYAWMMNLWARIEYWLSYSSVSISSHRTERWRDGIGRNRFSSVSPWIKGLTLMKW